MPSSLVEVAIHSPQLASWRSSTPSSSAHLSTAWLNPLGADAAELKKRTLTNLYNQRPTWLDLAHLQLDRAVLDAYGWPHT